MATITGLTAARMLEIEAMSVVGGELVAGHLILTKHDGSTIDAGDVLTLNVDDPTVKTLLDSRYAVLDTRKGCIIGKSIDTVVPATVVNLGWTTKISDLDAWFTGVANPTLVCPVGKGGRYLVTVNVLYSGTTGPSSSLSALINSTTNYDVVSSSGVFFTPTLTFVRTFVPGDTIIFQLYQSSGANRNYTARLEIAPMK